MNQGIIFNIQHFTIHDGPGIRTELFFKGCPLNCEWCSNPESLKMPIQLGVYESKCISQEKCGACKDVCPESDVLKFSNGKLISIDYEKCKNCFACYNSCPSDAIKQWGKYYTLEECMKEILKDKGYYDRSCGGVTVSGGEPLFHSNFIAELFRLCKKHEIHTCCESSFYSEWKEIEKILPYTDLIISDIKHMDRELHKKYTGVYNDKILENLKKLIKEKKELILRIPVIPDVNDDFENIKATADFILVDLKGKVRTLQLLSFMRLGEEKYKSIGMEYKMKNMEINREEFQKKVNKISEYFNGRGIHCLVGTKEKE